jgi:putative glycosyltransferase (TIGR04372 family)
MRSPFLSAGTYKGINVIFQLVPKILRRLLYIYHRVSYRVSASIISFYGRLANTPGRVAYKWLLNRGVELIDAHTNHIGHASIHTDYLVKQLLLEGQKNKIILFTYPPAKRNDRWKFGYYPNAYLHTLWQRHFRIFTSRFLRVLLRPVMWKGDGAARGRGYKLGDDYATVSRKTGRLIKLPAEDTARGYRLLAEMGMEDDAWFFCFYARSVHYKGSGAHNCRNCDIMSLMPAVQYLTDKGGWGIKMGAPTGNPLPTADRVIDYPESQSRTAFMDVFLAAHCRFFMGCTSGIHDLAHNVFHRTTIYHNFIPLFPLNWKLFFDDTVFIPKLLWLNEEGRYLKFAEIYESEISTFISSEQYEQAGIRVCDNDADDILNLTKEAFSRNIGDWSSPPGDNYRQKEFKELLQKRCSYQLTDFSMGADFLHKYEYLL